MIKQMMIFAAVLLLSVSSVNALEVGGANLDESLKIGNTDLVLNGAGVRNKFFLDVYACGLYLKEKTQDSKKIIDADEPMAIRISVLSGLMSADKMIGAYEEGFINSTNNNVDPLKDKIAIFIDGHKGEFGKKDVLDISYDPATGTTVTIKGKVTATVPGLDFKKAVFGIWLCDKPAQKDLKKKMLGK